MLIKANGVEGRLSRFALKILFLRSDSGVKKEDFQMQPVGLDLYKQLKRSYLCISFLFLLTKNMSTVNRLQSTDFEDESQRITGIYTDFCLSIVNIRNPNFLNIRN